MLSTILWDISVRARSGRPQFEYGVGRAVNRWGCSKAFSYASASALPVLHTGHVMFVMSLSRPVLCSVRCQWVMHLSWKKCPQANAFVPSGTCPQQIGQVRSCCSFFGGVPRCCTTSGTFAFVSAGRFGQSKERCDCPASKGRFSIGRFKQK